MKIVIDCREHKLVEHFKYREHVEVKQLDIGDVIFYDDNDTILILIERKTINDLASSIRDGRHREQKKRLMCSGLPIHKCLYLLEGDVNKVYSNRIDTRTIIGSIINTIIRDNIKVYRTDNLIDTKILLDRIYDKLLKEPHKLFESNIEYEATVKIAKKDNMTPEICNVIQLAQIPGISTKIARAIINEYSSFYSLCLKYQEINDIETNENLLSELKYNTSTGKSIRIGHKRSKKIYEYILNKN